MGTRLWDRIATLARADAHGVVDALEARELLVRQHLREAELALAGDRARLDALEEEATRLGDELPRARERVRALDEDVELALAGGKDELARFAVRRLLPERAGVRALELRLEDLVKERALLEERLAEREAVLDELRRRAQAERRARAAGPAVVPGTPEPPVSDEEVELELMRRARAEATR